MMINDDLLKMAFVAALDESCPACPAVEQQKVLVFLRDFQKVTYPLVNTQKTMENHHF